MALKCDLKVIACQNYDHKTPYELPIKPSPNLPNNRSIYLYPSLCFFEGTVISAGRGTNKQFQIYGHPALEGAPDEFTPQSMPGAKYPKFKGQLCKGYDLTKLEPENIRQEARLNLSYLLNCYRSFDQDTPFFLKSNFFDKLSGGKDLMLQIQEGKTEDEIRATWQEDLLAFKKIRKRYLIYPDFE